MIELRWVERGWQVTLDGGRKRATVLQYRHQVFNGYYDRDGVPALSGWSDWQDVPTVDKP